MGNKKKLAPRDKKDRFNGFDDDEFVRRYERLDEDADDFGEVGDDDYDEYEYDEDELDDEEEEVDEFES